MEASRLLSVSEASVCSVDMDEMSLMEGDWEGVAALLTAASVLREASVMKPDARRCGRAGAAASALPAPVRGQCQWEAGQLLVQGASWSLS